MRRPEPTDTDTGPSKGGTSTWKTLVGVLIGVVVVIGVVGTAVHAMSDVTPDAHETAAPAELDIPEPSPAQWLVIDCMVSVYWGLQDVAYGGDQSLRQVVDSFGGPYTPEYEILIHYIQQGALLDIVNDNNFNIWSVQSGCEDAYGTRLDTTSSAEAEPEAQPDAGHATSADWLPDQLYSDAAPHPLDEFGEAFAHEFEFLEGQRAGEALCGSIDVELENWDGIAPSTYVCVVDQPSEPVAVQVSVSPDFFGVFNLTESAEISSCVASGAKPLDAMIQDGYEAVDLHDGTIVSPAAVGNAQIGYISNREGLGEPRARRLAFSELVRHCSGEPEVIPW